MKITINNKKLDFKFKYSQLTKLLKETGKDVTQLDEIAKDFHSSSLILSIGCNISIKAATELLDDGSFEDITAIGKAFGEEVVQYVSPNSASQTN